MRKRDRYLIGSIVLAVVMAACAGFWESIGKASVERPHPPAPFPTEIADRLSVEELVQKTEGVGELILPTWMPRQFSLREIFFKGLALLTYGDREIEDYREANITIEISRALFSPTPEQLKEYLSGEIIQVGQFWVVIWENAAPDEWMQEHRIEPILADFYHKGFYYAITGRKAEISKAEMLQIVAGMQAVGPGTLGKT